MLNGIFQRPYLNNNQAFVRKKQDEEKNASAQREQQTDQNSRSKGLQYVEKQSPEYEQQVDWRQMRSQIQAQARQNVKEPVQQTRSSTINIAQILKDFRNTATAIGTPDNLKEEVNGYLSLIETQVKKENPNTKLVKSNLKNASSILDSYISETLNKDSKVVENWVDALFLQQIDFKYDESIINPQFLVKFPEGSTVEENKIQEKNVVEDSVTEPVQQESETNSKVVSLVPQDKELKSLFIQSKKLTYAGKPEKAIETFAKAIERADEVGDIETKSKIFYEVGRIYDDHSFLSEALKSYNQSIKITSDNNVKTKAHYSMAQIYDDINQVEPALDHYFNSISFAGEAENLSAQSTSLAKMGNIYTEMYDNQGFQYYSTAENLAEQTDNARVKGFISASMADAYETFGNSKGALKAYSNAVKHYTEADSPLKTAQNYTKAADIMVDFSNIDKAKGLLTKAQSYAIRTDDLNLINEIKGKLDSLSLLG